MRKKVAAIAVLVVVSLAFLLAPRREIKEPFTVRGWRAAVADEARWAVQRPRYRMREGAVAAALRCRNLEEVQSVLGKPDDQTLSGTTSYVYDLGALPRAVWFWKRGKYVTLEVWITNGKVNATVVVTPSTSPGDEL